jgi:hypothetical protein
VQIGNTSSLWDLQGLASWGYPFEEFFSMLLLLDCKSKSACCTVDICLPRWGCTAWGRPLHPLSQYPSVVHICKAVSYDLSPNNFYSLILVLWKTEDGINAILKNITIIQYLKSTITLSCFVFCETIIIYWKDKILIFYHFLFLTWSPRCHCPSELSTILHMCSNWGTSFL